METEEKDGDYLTWLSEFPESSNKSHRRYVEGLKQKKLITDWKTEAVLMRCESNFAKYSGGYRNLSSRYSTYFNWFVPTVLSMLQNNLESGSSCIIVDKEYFLIYCCALMIGPSGKIFTDFDAKNYSQDDVGIKFKNYNMFSRLDDHKNKRLLTDFTFDCMIFGNDSPVDVFVNRLKPGGKIIILDECKSFSLMEKLMDGSVRKSRVTRDDKELTTSNILNNTIEFDFSQVQITSNDFNRLKILSCEFGSFLDNKIVDLSLNKFDCRNKLSQINAFFSTQNNDKNQNDRNFMETVLKKIENLEKMMNKNFKQQSEEIKEMKRSLDNHQQAIQTLKQTIDAKLNQLTVNNQIYERLSRTSRASNDTASYISLSNFSDVIYRQQGNLLNRERETLFGLTGQNCTTLATGLVILSDEKCNQRSGVACFVKDKDRNSFFIRVYDCDQRLFVKEYDLKDEKECVDGLTFINQQEADRFKQAIDDKLMKHLTKLMEKKTGFSFRNRESVTKSLISLPDLNKPLRQNKQKVKLRNDIKSLYNPFIRSCYIGPSAGTRALVTMSYINCSQTNFEQFFF